VERLALETDLRHAIARDDIDVHLQPIVELDSGVVDAHEALARWTRAGATVPPSVFVPAAEESGLITALGDAVLVRAIAALRAGRAARVNVNLSPRQLLDPGLPARVQRVVTANDVAPQRLVFEITESVIIENFDIATRSLHELRDLGCPVGLDDFGTGHSSLGYLRRLPLDFLKLDRALIVGIDVDPQGAQIIEAILGLARTLSLTTIAEGVEREPQAEVLRAIGCEYGQGWLFGRPAPV
jgi:EAL domain-containing protein (putative c-di-GMP-specific phosphodiesterase class I)